MKQKAVLPFIATTLFVLLTSLSYSQNTIFSWAKQTGAGNDDFGNAIATDASGNVYTTGFFYGTVDFDPGPAVFNLTSAGGLEIFISKTDGAGNLMWAKRMGGAADDVSQDIAVDAAGNVYTTGQFQATVDFDPGAGTFNISSNGARDIFISKLDAAGNFVWAKRVGGINDDAGLSLITDAAGNLFSTGYFQATADFDPGAGTSNLTSSGSGDIFVLKLDGSGNFAWAKKTGGINHEAGNAIAADASGNLYVTGAFLQTVDFDPGAGIVNLTAAGSSDIFVFKLDGSGNFAWAKQLGGSNNEEGFSICTDAAGNVLTTGYFMGTADFDPGVPAYNLTSSSADVFISKLDAAGNFIWAKQFGGTGNARGFAITTDAAGNVYSTGRFYLTVDFDPGAGTYNRTSAGGSDIFISKLNASGNQLWTAQLGGTNDDAGLSIVTDAGNNICTTGRFMGVTDFDPGAPVYNLTSSGNADIFVLKMGQCAALFSSQNFVLCAGQSLTVGANTYNATGIYTDTFTVAQGCDSIVTTDLTVNPVIGVSQSLVLCAGQSVSVGLHTYTVSGSYADTLMAANGCDSTVSTYLTISAAIVFSQTPKLCAGQSISVGANTYSVTGIFTDTLTAANGCDSTVTTDLTIAPAITGTQTLTICAGQSVTVGANTYTATGTYTDTLIAANGCDSTMTTNLNVNTIDTSVTLNGITITANQAGASYQWIDCNNANSPINGKTAPSFTPAVNGNYAVIVTMGACSDTSSCVGVTTVGMEEDYLSTKIRIYPNPGNGLFLLTVEELFPGLSLELYNTLGEKVYTAPVTEKQMQVNISGLSKGLYFINLLNGPGIVKCKIVLQ